MVFSVLVGSYKKRMNKTLMPIPARRQFLGEAESMAGRAGIARRS